MATPHIEANKEDIAPIVLMPGDPLRAEFIARTYLQDVRQVNTIRNMFGYTGTFQGTPVSVMGSGMGMPSIGIYSYELYHFYDVQTIIRIGSAGAYDPQAKLLDVVLADSAYSESTFAKTSFDFPEAVQYPDKELNEQIIAQAKSLEIPLHVGRIHSSDAFYRAQPLDPYRMAEDKQCLCVEMESFALFANARALGKRAACLLTISDSFITKEETTAKQRQEAFTNMMEIALHTAISLA